MADKINKFHAALFQMAQACAQLRDSAIAMAANASEETDAIAAPNMIVWRGMLLAALEAAPGLRQLFIVPEVR